jgi:lon-related putative ATP-dependent protease
VLQDRLEATTRQAREIERDVRGQMEELDRSTISFAIGHPFEELLEQYSGNEDMEGFLQAVRDDVIENREFFKRSQEEDEGPQRLLGAALFGRSRSPLERYRVNVLVDNSGLQGAPVVIETNPTYHNLLGRIEHKAEFGALTTDYSMVKDGALHRANGGYLIIDAKTLLSKPFAYDALKRSLRTEEVKIEELSQQYSAMTFVGLAPEPIPLCIKVVLIGDPYTYYLLYTLDDEFQKLFKVRADFGGEMDRSRENVKRYAQFMHSRCEEEGLRDCDLSAVARIVEYGSRLASDQKKLTTQFADIADLIRESDYWAGRNGNGRMTAQDVQKAIDERIYRSNRVEERIREEIERDTLLVDTTGEVVGQVNGLSIIHVGDYMFGRPSRITARTYLGQSGVVNIEREAKMSGRIHDKGVMILSGYLGGKYAGDKPLSLSASLTFEQLYEGVEGDSASSAELFALLSSLSELPIRQDIAVTGSVDQRGEIQPIGGVNQKIEGFYKVCAARGLTGEQGVMIPTRNVEDLMLQDEVVSAVAAGRFHVYPISSIDQGISLLTGVEAGERDQEGRFPEGTLNYLVDERLRDMALQLKRFARTAETEGEGEKEEREEGPAEGPPPEVPPQ